MAGSACEIPLRDRYTGTPQAPQLGRRAWLKGALAVCGFVDFLRLFGMLIYPLLGMTRVTRMDHQVCLIGSITTGSSE
jgi:hypothetical protein